MRAEVERVLGAIRTKDIVETLSSLVRIRSENPPGDNPEIAYFIHKFLEESGFSPRIIPASLKGVTMYNVLCSLGGAPVLVLNAHHDTVPAGEGWTKDPFVPTIEGDKIFGRGTCDTKGSLACMMHAFKALSLVEDDLQGGVLLMAVADEEGDASHGTRYLLEKGFVKGKYAIVGEATALDIIVARKGVLWLKVKIYGKSAHGSLPRAGRNAIQGAVEAIRRLSEIDLGIREHPVLKRPTYNVGTIKGGIKVNVVPDYCEFTVDFRLLPGTDTSFIVKQVESLLSEVCEERDLRFELEVMFSAPPHEVDTSSPLVKAIDWAVTQIRGSPPKKLGRAGSSDVVFLGKMMDAVDLGCSGGRAHGPDEYARVSSLEPTAKAYALTALKLLFLGER